MDFSVVVCTYNRSCGLIVILESLALQKVPSNFDWEIVVVDNNSTDDTYDVVQKFSASSCVRVEYVFEPTVGLSHARNRGILEAKGTYVLFVEDDEIADKNLVIQLYNTFRTHGCECVGGKINLLFEDEKPDWLIMELWGFLGYLNYGDEPILMDEYHYPFGGNMTFKKEIFHEIGMFDINLGRKGRQLFGGEEHDLFLRLLKSGAKGVYQPKAMVQHRIDKKRMTKNYFRRLHFKSGMQKGLFSKNEYKRSFLGTPYFLFPQLFKSILIFLSSSVKVGGGIALRKEMVVWDFIGMIRGNFLSWLNRKNGLD